jgi:hypothetical protein
MVPSVHKEQRYMLPIYRLTFALLVATTMGAALLCALHGAASAQPSTPTASGDAVLPLRINQLVAENKASLVDPDEPAETPDWIELYNPNSTPVSLDGLALSDNPEKPAKFPITNGLTIPAQGFIIFFADDDVKQGPVHTNFKLDQQGERVSLYRVQGSVLIDRVDFPALEADQAYGRKPDGTGSWQFMTAPTPDRSNNIDAPTISAVTRPPYPAPTGAIVVSATVTDTEAVVGVTLVYTTAGAESQVTMTATGVPNVYEGAIPGQPAGALVSYYLAAVDNDGETSRFPIAGRDFRYKVGCVAPQVLLNEIVVENASLFVDKLEPQETPDWIELFNPGGAPVSLVGFSLTDDKWDPLRFVIRAAEVGTIGAGKRLTFLADDDKGQGPLHLNFALEKSGEFVGLFACDGTVLVDSFDVDDPPLWGSFSRIPDGAQDAPGTAVDAAKIPAPWSDLACPTYNAPNALCDRLVFLPQVLRGP